MNNKIPPSAFSIQMNRIDWEYAKARKPKNNAFRLAMLSFILTALCLLGAYYSIQWDYVRGALLLGLGSISLILAIVMLLIYNNQMKTNWNIVFSEKILVLNHQLPKGERILEIPYSKIEKVYLRFFPAKQKVSDKEHFVETSSWGRGNYYSPVIETETKVINLMELGRKEDQQWLVTYLIQEIKKLNENYLPQL